MILFRLAIYSVLVVLQSVSIVLADEEDAAEGEAVFKIRCIGCHDVTPEASLSENNKPKQGPSLYGVIGRTAGKLPGFAYSDAMVASGIDWSRETLDAYLLSPKTVVPRNKMVFNGIKREGEMENLLEYLEVATQ